MDILGRFKVGDFVRLTAEARQHRIENMKRREGIVDGYRDFPLKQEGQPTQERHWIIVDWGIRTEDKRPHVWTERPEDLIIS